MNTNTNNEGGPFICRATSFVMTSRVKGESGPFKPFAGVSGYSADEAIQIVKQHKERNLHLEFRLTLHEQTTIITKTETELPI